MVTFGPKPSKPHRVLIVDDDESARITFGSLLEEHGYVVETASNGQEALRRIQKRPPVDLIVLDLFMPVMDGWQFREEQKRIPAVALIPVVVVSAAELATQSIDAAAHLEKPVAFERLLEEIWRVSERPRH
ncbi:MAG: response regulator [Myxococcota bacterium]